MGQMYGASEGRHDLLLSSGPSSGGDDPRVDAVLRVLRGEDVSEVASELAVESDLLSRWLAQFIAGGRDRLVHGDADRPVETGRSDRLLALVAHELRTPVSVIGGWLRVLSDHVDDGHDGATALNEVRTSSERLRRLVDDLLDTTAASLGRYRYVEVRLDVRDIVTQAICSDDHVETSLPSEPQPVGGDEDGLVRVVQRLVLGARLGESRAPLRVDVVSVGPWVEVAVTRVGTQLPFETVHTMLEPFEAPDEQPVASLGLYMARSVTVAHRGYLGARGSTDGTTFWIRLPRSDKG